MKGVNRSRLSSLVAATLVVASVVSAAPQSVDAQTLAADSTGSPSSGASIGSPLATMWIARLQMKTAVYRGLSNDVLRKGTGYWPGTALPGQLGNMVVGGHRVTWPEPFRHIDTLRIGDTIVIKYKNKHYTYVVSKKRIVTPTDTWVLSQRVSKPTLTIFACHPPGSIKQRYVVTAVLRK